MKFNLYKKSILLVFFTITLFTNCKKPIKEPSLTPKLAFVENNLAGNLPFGGGSITLEVDWAYIRWNIIAEEQSNDAITITEMTPSSGGFDSGVTKTQVKISFRSNDSYTAKSRTLVLRSPNGALRTTLKLNQAARVLVPIDISLNPSVTFQKISGFGAANNIWGTDFLTNNEIKSAFGLGETELGLNILRVGLSPNRNEWPSLVNTIKEAKKYGALILASPWSPPAQWKSNKNLVGGFLLEQHYADYAKYIDDYIKYMESQGAAIDVVSIQNEPDITVSYEGCVWSIDQIHKFMRDHGASITGAKVMAAESFNFKQSYTDKILSDPIAVENLDIIGGHIYGGGLAPYPFAEQKGKEVWMTEYLMNQNSGSNSNNWNQSASVIWDESINMMETIHESMTINWNAYIWWYARRYYSFLGDGEFGTTRGTILKRGYAMSNYSKFIRPGYRRIAVQPENNATTRLKITAYRGDNKVIVVIINPETYPIHGVSFSLPQSINSATTYTTSLSQNMMKETLTSNNRKVLINMEGKSVKTLVLE